ncbi:MAG TPA: alpha/beta fold hydrolase [Mycobacteriales bacterium]|nr:alpha/beta fold hydrolase [Mycobacteriales bacterium]
MIRRGRRRTILAGLAAATLIAAGAPTYGEEDTDKPGRTKPQGPAAVKFARDVPALTDSEWKWRLGGFGGLRKGAPRRHVPVIFVHGNTVDAADWYPVRNAFRAAGWTDQELWALSYNGLGGSSGTALFTPNPERDEEHRAMGKDAVTYVTENDVNVADLHAFLLMVRRYTGSTRFAIVAHSLGVTLARETLRVHPELRRNLVSFVGIAGGNQGTSLCPPGTEGRVVACDEIAAGTPWLQRLNAAGQTYPPAKWMTVYDGSGVADPAFAATYAASPRLEGADNRQFPGTYHNDLRLDPAIVKVYREFLEQSEKAVRR